MRRHRSAAFAVFALGLLSAAADASEPRIAAAIEAPSSFNVAGSTNPLARSEGDLGELPGNTRLEAVSLYLRPSDQQQAELGQLLRDQQDPSSANYHKWITPNEYAERFGVSDADLAKIRVWLEGEGLSVLDLAPGASRVRFSGTVSQIEAAFATEIHRYNIDGELHFANARELAVPAVLSGMVSGFRNLADFRPRPRITRLPFLAAPQPGFTSSASGNHFLAPADIATIYGLNGAYASGYTGASEKIAVVGQTAINTSDIDAFRAAAGLGAKDPTLVLVPNSGASTVVSDDEVESDLDVEWAGAIAKDAEIVFIYTGNNQNSGVFDALAYAIENNLAPVVTISYGDCEADLGQSDVSTMEGLFKQASAQGQTIVASSGDNGAADCDYSANANKLITAATHGKAVDYPASSTSVTGVGGTTFDEGSGSYWSTTNDSGNGSALGYIPEVAWNDTSSTIGLLSGGGGASKLFSKPDWQSGAGVPADGRRDVPDVALAASPNHDGYLYCSGGSCVNGFRAANSDLTVAGGTSFAAPVFAGIVALLNQAGGAGGLGNVNSRLYAAAAGAFHDITGGNNDVPCTAGSTDCGAGGTFGYSAGTGYDQVTGLGSPNVENLIAGFVPNTASGGTTTGGATISGAAASGGSSGSSGGGALGWPLLLLLGLAALSRRAYRMHLS